MKSLLSLITIIFLTTAKGQTIPYDSYQIDMLTLKDFSAKRIVAYNFQSVIFYVDYEDYKKEFQSLWDTYNRGVKDAARAKRKGNYYDKDYEKKWPFLDSVYPVLTNLTKNNDTVFLSHNLFYQNNFSDLNDFFPNLIEKKRCTIININGERQTIIIRQTGSHAKSGEGFGGRRYFLPGQANFFVEATDWET